jgi:sugar/nucleoside kinase (ribokinase family)
VGFSVNTELSITADWRNQTEKLLGKDIDFRIGGTSVNVSVAMQTFGGSGSSKILALVGNDDSEFTTRNLNFELQKLNIPHVLYPILEKSHFAFSPVNGETQKKISIGYKGKINCSDIKPILSDIKKQTGLWRIATGVRPEEAIFIECLFDKSPGCRSLNPRDILAEDKQVFPSLLKKTDLLIFNMEEFNACEVASISDFHKLGPVLVIVTDGKKGGIFSHRNFGVERYQATNYVPEDAPTYTIGAGDWFHASFVAMARENNKPYSELSHEELLEFINFASKVAGKKVTMNGSINGPTRDML